MLQPTLHRLSAVHPLPVSAKIESHPVYRRPTKLQGRALETIGHAIEYLVDSRKMDEPGRTFVKEKESIDILSQRSREIYGACAEVVPVRQRLEQWFTRCLIDQV